MGCSVHRIGRKRANKRAIIEVLPEAYWQRCYVHFLAQRARLSAREKLTEVQQTVEQLLVQLQAS
jgi:transposase-like protein